MCVCVCVCVCVYLAAPPRDLQDLNSLTRDRTCAPYSRSVVLAADCLGSPKFLSIQIYLLNFNPVETIYILT